MTSLAATATRAVLITIAIGVTGIQCLQSPEPGLWLVGLLAALIVALAELSRVLNTIGADPVAASDARAQRTETSVRPAQPSGLWWRPVPASAQREPVPAQRTFTLGRRFTVTIHR